MYKKNLNKYLINYCLEQCQDELDDWVVLAQDLEKLVKALKNENEGEDKEALKLYQELEQIGYQHNILFYRLAYFFGFGLGGLVVDCARARLYFEKAAVNGFAPACLQICKILEQEEMTDEAAKCYQKYFNEAVNQQFAPALLSAALNQIQDPLAQEYLKRASDTFFPAKYHYAEFLRLARNGETYNQYELLLVKDGAAKGCKLAIEALAKVSLGQNGTTVQHQNELLLSSVQNQEYTNINSNNLSNFSATTPSVSENLDYQRNAKNSSSLTNDPILSSSNNSSDTGNYAVNSSASNVIPKGFTKVNGRLKITIPGNGKVIPLASTSNTNFQPLSGISLNAPIKFTKQWAGYLVDGVYHWNSSKSDKKVEKKLSMVSAFDHFKRNLISLTNSIPPINSSVSVNNNMPVVNNNMPVVNNNMPVVNNNMPVVNNNMPVVNKNVPVVNKNVPVVNTNVPVNLIVIQTMDYMYLLQNSRPFFKFKIVGNKAIFYPEVEYADKDIQGFIACIIKQQNTINNFKHFFEVEQNLFQGVVCLKIGKALKNIKIDLLFVFYELMRSTNSKPFNLPAQVLTQTSQLNTTQLYLDRKQRDKRQSVANNIDASQPETLSEKGSELNNYRKKKKLT
ncbi:MAG: hypothetical protein JSS07_06485 [Proteobacteria bacterium]|nr:hypothetical protein [Pseudomonadota bacterium]